MPNEFKSVPVYYPADPKDAWKSGYTPYKMLKANTAAELEALQRIGWKLEPPQ